MTKVKIQEGKIYLRDTRNGSIYEYEHLLSQMSYMQKFTGGTEVEKVSDDFRPQPPMAHLTPLERATEYDRLARMSNEDREKEIAKQKEAKKKQEEANNTVVDTKKKYKLTAKTEGASLKSFTEKGWTIPLMIEHGMLELVEDGSEFDVELSNEL